MNQTSDTTAQQIAMIEAELRELRTALDNADDYHQQARIRAIINSRRSQMADLKRRRPDDR